jgi:hypothetical protein
MENEPVRRARVRRSREEIAEMIEEYRRSGPMQGGVLPWTWAQCLFCNVAVRYPGAFAVTTGAGLA